MHHQSFEEKLNQSLLYSCQISSESDLKRQSRRVLGKRLPQQIEEEEQKQYAVRS